MKSLMLQGTTSSAGKTTLVTGLARIFTEAGIDVFPFKSQNMSRNFCLTDDGKRISTAQFIQAFASRKKAEVRMNPLLLIPQTDTGSEVVYLGESLGVMPAREYFSKKADFKPKIIDLYKKISCEHDLVLIEGAGSPAEINLNDNDFVNTGMAEIADANVLLVTDIDRGGSFASLYGTVMLLKEEDRKRIKGFIINKFRGDKSLLESGNKMIEDLTGIPVVGVIPFMKLEIADEDSIVDYQKKANSAYTMDELDLEIEKLKDLIKENLDMNKIFELIEE